MKFRDQLIAVILRAPRRLLFLNLLLLLAVGYGASRLYIETGIEVFFSDTDPNLLAEKATDRIYGRYDNILIVIDGDGASLFTRPHLAAIETITERAWQTPHSRRVDSVSNFQYPSVDGDDILIGNLFEGARQLDDAGLARTGDIALSRQALVGRLLSPGGSTAAVNISLQFPAEQRAIAVAEAVGFARELATELRADSPQLTVYLAGTAVTEQTLAEVTGADGASLMPLLFAMVLLLVAVLLRSAMAALCTVIAISLSIAAGMGYAGWAGVGINSVNVSAPTIIMTLAVADCIHLLSVFLTRLRSGAAKPEALRSALEKTLYPIFLTSVTTALGFLSMNFSESPPFRDLGTISAVGVIGALYVTVTILPGLVLMLPFSGRGKSQTGLSVRGLAALVTRHHNRVFYGTGLAIAIAVAFLLRIELNDDPTTYFSEAIPITQAMAVIETRLSGTQSLDFSLDSGEPEGIAEPEFLRRADAFVSWLRAQPEVVNVQCYTDTLKRLNQVMHEDDPHWLRLPDERPMAAQYTLLYEMSVPYGLDVTHQVSADKSALKVTVTVNNQRSRGLVEFEQRSRQWLQQNMPELSTRGSGQSVSFAHVGLRNIRSMLAGSLFALALISLCLVAAFRSLRYGLLSLVPNLFPALVSLGIWAALVGQVNMAASVVFSLTLGIIVDDTTHFLTNYLRARRSPGADAVSAVLDTFEAVGSALLSTSIVLTAGFLVLVQSDFAVNSTSGLLVAMTITVAIVLDFLFLPALLIKADKWLNPASK